MNEVNVKLNNVRLSFPALWEAKQGPDANSKSSYQAAFIMDKKSNAADIKAVQDAIATVVRESFKGKVPPKICLRDGAEKETDGYGPTVMFLNARSDRRPGVVGRDMAPLTKDDGKPYAGSYVNATIRVWAQDNQYGKRINAALRAVQFVKDGAPFGEGNVDVAQEFTALDGDVI
mgnify:FL=1|jgi:hypothetical protein